MNRRRLTDKEMAELKRLHRTTRDKRKADRIKAIVLLGKGWSDADVAEALLVDPKTINHWFARYADGGVDSLLKDGHRGGLSYLTPEQLRELESHLADTHYLHTKDIIAYIEKRFGVAYTQSGLTDLLHRLGFVYTPRE